jgi:hypothetical protein
LRNTAAEIPDDIRMVQAEDIEKIDTIKNFEELKDMEQLFRAYYSRDRDQIKLLMIKKRKEDRESRKIQKVLSTSIEQLLILSKKNH